MSADYQQLAVAAALWPETSDADVDAVIGCYPGLLDALQARDGDPDGSLDALRGIVSWWPDLSDESVGELLAAFPALAAKLSA